jgi:hypothetical protein
LFVKQRVERARSASYRSRWGPRKLQVNALPSAALRLAHAIKAPHRSFSPCPPHNGNDQEGDVEFYSILFGKQNRKLRMDPLILLMPSLIPKR